MADQSVEQKENVFGMDLDGDRKMLEIHRHPFGIIILYIGMVIAVVAILFILQASRDFLDKNISHNLSALVSAASIIIVVIMALVLFVATYVYRESRLIVGNDNLTQVLQNGLFSKKISRLSMSNVEDVSAEQHGIFATMFNYGTLTVETAGEQENFVFPYCPSPTHYAGEILAAREQFIKTDMEQAYKLTHPGQPG